MEATGLSCGVYLVMVEEEHDAVVIDYLAAYPQRLGTIRISRQGAAADTIMVEQLRRWCTAQTPVWIVEGPDGVTVSSSSRNVERHLQS